MSEGKTMAEAAGTIRFDDQVVLISGAGRGIGRAHALLFGQRGAHVVVNDIDHDVASEVVGEIVAAGGSATAAAGDVVDDAVAIVGAALGVRGRLDALVNNAGIAYCGPFGQSAAADMERLMRVHAIGTAALTAAAWEALVASRGRVVNTTSNSVLGLAWHTAYAAAKGAILGFTRALAFEAEEVGVKVNAIMPMARTRMYEIAGGQTGDEIDVMMTKHFPPERIAPVVVYLASTEVPFNGQVIEVSGGTTAHVHFAVSPYLPAGTPEEARAALASEPTAFGVCRSNGDMLTDKMSRLA
jgi:NAD(P)-dependent dehydrogenase (short-subunit alcohol dehydrogenase family)